MQVLGMLPKKERKKKPEKEPQREKDTEYFQDRERDKQESSNSILLENRLSFQDRIKIKSKYSNTKLKPEVVRGSSIDDPDDPYAFPPDPVSDSCTKSNCLSPPQLPVDMLVLNSAISSTALNCSTRSPAPGESTAPATSIAKMYPELAEKLERIKPKNEPKLKGKVKSSRTMNQLQTKIAQNKIKDKMKRNQESSCHSHSQSPSNGFSPSPSQGYDCISLTSAGHSPVAAPAISHPQPFTSNRTSPQMDPILSHNDPLQVVPPDFMGFAHLAQNPLFHHPLPPPYVSTTSSALVSPNLPHPPLYQFPSPTQPQQTPPPPLVSPHSHPPSNLLPPPPPSPSTHTGIPHSIPYPGHELPFSHHPKPLALEPSLPPLPPPPLPLPTQTQQTLSIQTSVSNFLQQSPKCSPHVPPPPSPAPLPTFPVSLPQHVPLLNLPATTTHVTSTITTSSSSSSTISSTSVTSVIPTTSVTSTELKPPLTSTCSTTSMPARSSASQSHIYPTFTLPVARTRPRKAKNILMEKEAHRKLQLESAVKYYSYYVRRRIMNHSFFNCSKYKLVAYTA